MKIRKFIFVLMLIGIGTIFSSCNLNNHYKNLEPIKIKNKVSEDLEIGRAPDTNETLSVAIAAMISPKETFSQYEKLLDYVQKKVGKKIQLKQRKTYAEVNNLLRDNELDFAFVCSGAYVQARKEFHLKILVVPVVNGEPFYRAYIIAHKNKKIKSFKDLLGKSFAFTDPLSNTGYNYAIKELKKLGTTPERFFSKVIFTYAHDNSIQAVSRGIVDGASVDGQIFEYLKKFSPERVKNIQIIQKSKPFGIPPIVYPAEANKRTIQKIRNVFLNMHKTSEGKEILSKLLIDKFIVPNPNIYNSLEK